MFIAYPAMLYPTPWCARWLGPGASGMAIQELGVPSGFEADTEGLAQFTEIKRVEAEDRKLILYFDQVMPYEVHCVKVLFIYMVIFTIFTCLMIQKQPFDSIRTNVYRYYPMFSDTLCFRTPPSSPQYN